MIVGIDPSWKQHPDDKRVWVSPEGRVFKKINDKHPERRQWMEYAQDTDKDDYKTVRIRGRKWLIHRLVYLLFVGPLDPTLVVCHCDGNQQNNHWGNLLQATQQENISHKVEHGTHQAGEDHPRAIHTNEQIAAARAAIALAPRSRTGRLKRGEAARIAKLTSVSIHTVHDLNTKEKCWC